MALGQVQECTVAYSAFCLSEQGVAILAGRVSTIMRLIRITDLANAGEAKSEGIRKLSSYAKEKKQPRDAKNKKLEVVEFNPASHTTTLNFNFRFTTHHAKKIAPWLDLDTTSRAWRPCATPRGYKDRSSSGADANPSRNQPLTSSSMRRSSPSRTGPRKSPRKFL